MNNFNTSDLFQVEENDESYCKFITPLETFHAHISGYCRSDVIEILAALWGYPATEYDAYNLITGVSAEIVFHCFPNNQSYQLQMVKRPKSPHMKYLHTCDIAYYKSTPLLLEMLQRDRCFVSLDSLSLRDAKSSVDKETEQGVFLVHQLSHDSWPTWSHEAWRAFGCDPRSHTTT